MSDFNLDNFTELDKDIIDDFYFCFRESVEEIEQSFYHLDRDPDSDEINNLFRSMHSLKGNCRMVFLDPLVTSTHMLEEIVSDLRAGRYDYNKLLGEYIFTTVSRIEKMVSDLLQGGDLNLSRLQQLDLEIISLRDAADTDRLHIAEQLLNREVIDDTATEIPADIEDNNTQAEESSADTQTETDLEFFYSLGLKLDSLSIYNRDRIKEVNNLCQSINEELQNPVDTDQLSCAVYLHDLAMPLVPPRILNLDRELRREEASIYYDHCRVAAELLLRMPLWCDAAYMIAQHHEHFDGSGFPNRCRGDEIHLGAAIIAVSDCFEEMLFRQTDISPRKNLFKAVNEVNSFTDSHFCPEVVNAFNVVIRRRFVSSKT